MVATTLASQDCEQLAQFDLWSLHSGGQDKKIVSAAIKLSVFQGEVLIARLLWGIRPVMPLYFAIMLRMSCANGVPTSWQYPEQLAATVCRQQRIKRRLQSPNSQRWRTPPSWRRFSTRWRGPSKPWRAWRQGIRWAATTRSGFWRTAARGRTSGIRAATTTANVPIGPSGMSAKGEHLPVTSATLRVETS